jgi:hypothetical protein
MQSAQVEHEVNEEIGQSLRSFPFHILHEL